MNLSSTKIMVRLNSQRSLSRTEWALHDPIRVYESILLPSHCSRAPGMRLSGSTWSTAPHPAGHDAVSILCPLYADLTRRIEARGELPGKGLRHVFDDHNAGEIGGQRSQSHIFIECSSELWVV
jgi:hypothetical protein